MSTESIVCVVQLQYTVLRTNIHLSLIKIITLRLKIPINFVSTRVFFIIIRAAARKCMKTTYILQRVRAAARRCIKNLKHFKIIFILCAQLRIHVYTCARSCARMRAYARTRAQLDYNKKIFSAPKSER